MFIVGKCFADILTEIALAVPAFGAEAGPQPNETPFVVVRIASVCRNFRLYLSYLLELGVTRVHLGETSATVVRLHAVYHVLQVEILIFVVSVKPLYSREGVGGTLNLPATM